MTFSLAAYRTALRFYNTFSNRLSTGKEAVVTGFRRVGGQRSHGLGHLAIVSVLTLQKFAWLRYTFANPPSKASDVMLYQLFVCSIFSKKPEAPEKYFKRVHGDDMHSPEFKAHAGRVLSGFDMSLSLLDDEGPFQAQLHHLEEQHNEMHIPAEYFDVRNHCALTMVIQNICTFTCT